MQVGNKFRNARRTKIVRTFISPALHCSVGDAPGPFKRASNTQEEAVPHCKGVIVTATGDCDHFYFLLPDNHHHYNLSILVRTSSSPPLSLRPSCSSAR